MLENGRRERKLLVVKILIIDMAMLGSFLKSRSNSREGFVFYLNLYSWTNKGGFSWKIGLLRFWGFFEVVLKKKRLKYRYLKDPLFIRYHNGGLFLGSDLVGDLSST